MSNPNVNPDKPTGYDQNAAARAAAANNLTWGIAVALVILALAAAIVYVATNLHL
jgi:tetrahydromethanopterin S-methyltransferase subunit B